MHSRGSIVHAFDLVINAYAHTWVLKHGSLAIRMDATPLLNSKFISNDMRWLKLTLLRVSRWLIGELRLHLSTNQVKILWSHCTAHNRNTLPLSLWGLFLSSYGHVCYYKQVISFRHNIKSNGISTQGIHLLVPACSLQSQTFSNKWPDWQASVTVNHTCGLI